MVIKFLIAEYASALAPEDVGIVVEGFSMLRCLSKDLREHCDVHCFLSERLTSFSNMLPNVIEVKQGESFEYMLEKYSEDFDCMLIIAPETKNMLAKFVEIVENKKVNLANSSSSFTSITSDKHAFLKLASNHNLPTPKTFKVESINELSSFADELGYPFVVKPERGAGAYKARIVKNEQEVKKVTEIFNEDEIIIAQEYIQGKSISVSLMVSQGEIVPISVNLQSMYAINDKFEYRGGIVPLLNYEKAKEIARTACEIISGAKGYIGLDLIAKDEEEFVLMELNPRITTSYVGLSMLNGTNMGKAILYSCFDKSLSDIKLMPKGFCAFRKITAKREKLEEPCKVICPRIKNLVLIACVGNSREEAEERLRKATLALMM